MKAGVFPAMFATRSPAAAARLRLRLIDMADAAAG